MRELLQAGGLCGCGQVDWAHAAGQTRWVLGLCKWKRCSAQQALSPPVLLAQTAALRPLPQRLQALVVYADAAAAQAAVELLDGYPLGTSLLEVQVSLESLVGAGGNDR